MKIFAYALLTAVCCLFAGCGSTPPPAPVMTDDLRAAIAEEDSRVQAEESKR